jgi:hypothetical protein
MAIKYIASHPQDASSYEQADQVKQNIAMGGVFGEPGQYRALQMRKMNGFGSVLLLLSFPIVRIRFLYQSPY